MTKYNPSYLLQRIQQTSEKADLLAKEYVEFGMKQVSVSPDYEIRTFGRDDDR